MKILSQDFNKNSKVKVLYNEEYDCNKEHLHVIDGVNHTFCCCKYAYTLYIEPNEFKYEKNEIILRKIPDDFTCFCVESYEKKKGKLNGMKKAYFMSVPFPFHVRLEKEIFCFKVDNELLKM
jgi:hypothetical protein